MNQIESKLNTYKYGIYESSLVTDLLNIFEKDCSIAVLRRNPILEIQEELDRIKLMPFLHKEIISLDNVDASEIFEFLKEKGFIYLQKDLYYLIEMYTDLFDCSKLGLRFGLMDSVLCPKFHTDFLEVRMICTYFGEGTEYLYSTQNNRSKLKFQHETGDMEEFDNIQRASLFDLVLLKGEHFPDNKGYGAIHRSPQMVGGTRIFFSLDRIE
jgi:hypothetical protein